jgi:hypothetical protein
MSKFVRSWIVGGALLAVAVVGCQHSQSGCATCGHGPVVTTPTGSTYHETAAPTIGQTFTPANASGGPMPMPMPSSQGIQAIDGPGVR